jgi:hypothetical protein
MDNITEDEITEAVSILSRSERGHQVLMDVHQLLQNGATSLDGHGQLALLTLICAGLNGMAGTALASMRTAILRRSGPGC